MNWNKIPLLEYRICSDELSGDKDMVAKLRIISNHVSLSNGSCKIVVQAGEFLTDLNSSNEMDVFHSKIQRQFKEL